MAKVENRITLKFVVIASVLCLICNTYAGKPDAVPGKTFDSWFASVSNWGRWGSDDQQGTLNLITPETRIAAAKLVTSGISVSLAHDALTNRSSDNPSPYLHQMISNLSSPEGMGGASDSFSVAFHGVVHSHIDAVCHINYKGKLFNNIPSSTVTEQGCEKLSVMAVKNGIFGRGVLMDIPRLKGVPWLEPGTSIYASDLEAWAEKAGVELRSGDILLLRTGFWARRASEGPTDFYDEGHKIAGLHASAVKWLHEKDIAVLGSDAVGDVHPTGVEGYSYPVHVLIMTALGAPILDALDLEKLAEVAAKQNRWEFLFTAAPLRMKGGTGSPLNPIATF